MRCTSMLLASVFGCVAILGISGGGAARSGPAVAALDSFTPEEQQLIEEHVYGGLPSSDGVKVRQGYVISFNAETRTPNWVAYHIEPDYRKTPSRKGWAKSFRADPDIANEAKDDDYVGLLRQRGYARGHLAPYGIMGGDRNGNGKYAEYDKNDPSDRGDPFDAKTVEQGNYMSNIAPQHHEGFNGWKKLGSESIPGLWFELERWIQDDLVRDGGHEAWVIAGCIFGRGEHEKVGLNKDIWVPPMFYKIVVFKDEDSDLPVVLAYLFPHQRVRHGELDHFLVSIDVIEALAGVDFFNAKAAGEMPPEDRDTWETAQLYFEYE